MLESGNFLIEIRLPAFTESSGSVFAAVSKLGIGPVVVLLRVEVEIRKSGGWNHVAGMPVTFDRLMIQIM